MDMEKETRTAPTPAPKPAIADLCPEVQAALEAAVREFKAHLEVLPEIRRRMLRVARQYRLSPEDFRSRLVRAGLKPPRASELKTVLAAPDSCDAFLGQAHQPWEETLAGARLYLAQKEFGLTPPALLAARIAGLMFKSRVASLPAAGGLLVLEPMPVDLESVSVVSRL